MKYELRELADLHTLELAENFLDLLVTFLALEVHFKDQGGILVRSSKQSNKGEANNNNKKSCVPWGSSTTNLCCHGDGALEVDWDAGDEGKKGIYRQAARLNHAPPPPPPPLGNWSSIHELALEKRTNCWFFDWVGEEEESHIGELPET
jgi:hypothetical protein